MDFGVKEVAALLSSGGVVVLAILVYMELRQIRPILTVLQAAVTALLERERARSGPVRVRRDPTPLPDLTHGGEGE